MSVFSIDHRSNHALDVNRPNANKNLSVHGSNWLWAVTAVTGLAFLSWLAWTILRNKPQRGYDHHSKNSNISDVNNPNSNKSNINDTDTHHTNKNNIGDTNNGVHRQLAPDVPLLHSERIFHYLFTIAAFITFVSYFTMASDLGNTPIRQYMNHGSNYTQTRQVFYVRYIYYFTAWPLVLIANLLLSGVSWATILFVVALQEIWVVSWLSGALVTTSYKWGYFAFGLFAYLTLGYLLLSWGIGHAQRIRTKKDYTLLAGLLVLVWALYPIAWGLSEGSNKLSVTGEMVFYGILDLIAIPIYGTLFLYLATKRFGPALFPFTQTGRISGSEYTRTQPSNTVSTPVQGGIV